MVTFMASSVVTPEDVLESLMNDGTIDSIRLKIINQLKANEELKNNTIAMVEQSKVLNTPGAEKQTKRELFDSLRRELETPALEKASKAVWELILDNNGLGKEISEIVEKIYCRLSGVEHPLPLPQPDSVTHPEKRGTEDKVKEGETSKPSCRKRSFGEMSTQDGAEAAANGTSADHPPVTSDDGVQSETNTNQ